MSHLYFFITHKGGKNKTNLTCFFSIFFNFPVYSFDFFSQKASHNPREPSHIRQSPNLIKNFLIPFQTNYFHLFFFYIFLPHNSFFLTSSLFSRFFPFFTPHMCFHQSFFFIYTKTQLKDNFTLFLFNKFFFFSNPSLSWIY